jgi:hypothetical protein
MEESLIHLIETFFYQKIMLYDDLLRYLNEETVALINIDMDKLWRISGKKEEICERIASVRQEIISSVYPSEDQKEYNINEIMRLMPYDRRSEFQKLHLRLIKLKKEIEVVRKENMIFIDESLQLLDDVISIITGATGSRMMYNDKCQFKKSETHLLFSREV